MLLQIAARESYWGPNWCADCFTWRATKKSAVEARILSDNGPMLALANHFHFDCVPDGDLASLIATHDFDAPHAASDARHI